MRGEAGFNDAVLQLYAAAMDPALWPRALSSLEDASGSVGAVIDFAATNPACAHLTLAGRFSLEECAEYARDHAGHCRRITTMASRPDLPFIYDKHVLSEREMDFDPVYDWLGKHGLRYFIGASVGLFPDHHCFLSFQRSPQQGHVQSTDVSVFASLLPHVRQAIALAHQIETLRHQARFGEAIAGTLERGVFLLDAGGAVLQLNPAALAMVRSGDGPDIRRGGLCWAGIGGSEVARAIVEVADPGQEPAARWLSIPRGDGRLPFLLFIAPVSGDGGLMAASAPRVMLVVTDPETLDGGRGEALRQLFGLSPGEARVALGVASGRSVPEVAGWFGIAPATARTQLNAAFHKMGIHRQQDLARILGALSLLSPAADGASPDRGTDDAKTKA